MNAENGMVTFTSEEWASISNEFERAERRVAELENLINSPEIENFLVGIVNEGAHQRVRWGEAKDREKSPEHWHWLLAYLAGKALRAAMDGNREKALHHTISTAAACMHWHSAIKAAGLTWLKRDDEDLAARDREET